MTPVPAVLRRAVYARDNGSCQRCGRECLDWQHSIQHRLPGQMGGDRHKHQLANMVLMCGTGTTGCHGWAESHREQAHAQGWLVHRWETPATVPILRYTRTWWLLGADWEPTRAPEEVTT